MKKRYPVLRHALLIGIGAVLLYGGLTNSQDWGDDYAAYIMQARSLIEGTVADYIEANRFTITQSSRIIGPVTYPWGMPVLLAPVYACFGLNYFAIKLVIAAFYILFLGLLAVGFRKQHTPSGLLCLVGLFALNPIMLAAANDIESDIPFLLFSILGVLLIGKRIVKREHIISPVWDNGLLGAVIAVACFFRTPGILLLATLLCTQLLVFFQFFWIERSGQDASASMSTLIRLLRQTRARGLGIHCLPYGVYLVMVAAWRALLPYDGSAYTNILHHITPGTIKYHLEYYATLPIYFYTGAPFPTLIYILSLPLALVGVARRFRSDYHVLVFTCLTLALYVLWPEVQGLRFIYPLLPFYISFVLTGLEAFSGREDSPRHALRTTLCALPVIVVLVSFGLHSAATTRTNLLNSRIAESDAFNEATQDMFTFIQTNTEPDSTIAFFKPRLMHMITGRPSLLITTVPELPKADYFCLYTVRLYRQMPFGELYEQAELGTIDLIYENSDFKVYRVLPDQP